MTSRLLSLFPYFMNLVAAYETLLVSQGGMHDKRVKLSGFRNTSTEY